MSNGHPVRELVIVGRDAPAWLSACVVQFALAPAGVNVSVVELPSAAQAADLCLGLPALEPLHARLRIDERKLMAATRAAFTLGRHFVDGAGQAPAFFHAHGSTGSRIDEKEFLPQWLLARRRGVDRAFDEFSLTTAAARHGRMLLPDTEIEESGFTDYGYHLPAIPYAAWLRQLALRRGVRVHAATGCEVHLDAQRRISRLVLDGARGITGDFFLDATGAEALLMRALGVGQQSWREIFPADRVLDALAPPLAPLPIYSEVRAHAAGWVSLAVSQVCTHVQQAWSSELLPDSAALDFAARTACMPLQGAVIRERHPARRHQAWMQNCVALGDAACVFDAVHGVGLQALQVGLVHLLPLFPVQPDYDAERDEYNHNVRAAFERIRDFQVAHYCLNRYGLPRYSPGSKFWDRARAVVPGAELAHKLDAFRARGEAVDYEHESFSIDDWRALLIGHGVIPETYDPAVDRTPPEVLTSELGRILGFIRHKIDQQRPHAEYLATR